ncbi:MAG: dTDP-4-dehydrorhamnose reductase [Deltaproteobacteria bacterium]|nr:dTDP-4-dehydrorhamnose reductase [Deltaproteobacteria bacterium]
MNDFAVPCLVIGARGMLGHDLCLALKDAGAKIVEMDIPEIDICNLSSVRAIFQKVRPRSVINVAAFTDVDGCETQTEAAFSVNAIGPENLAIVARGSGSYLVHISTDYVFDGSKKEPYKEDDPANPLGIYGKSKWEGEVRLRKTLLDNYCIIRTQWLYGANGKNFVDTIIRAAKRNKILKIVNDQLGSPTYTVDLAMAIVRLCQMQATGVFHVTNKGTTTWSDFAAKILEFVGLTNVKIENITTNQLGRAAPRPLYSVLDNTKFENLTSMKMPLWENAVEKYLSGRTV